MKKYTENFEAGAKNLLLNCAQARPGDRVLLVGEQCGSPLLKSPVVAIIEDSQIVNFNGDEKEIAKIREQFERAASLICIAPFRSSLNP